MLKEALKALVIVIGIVAFFAGVFFLYVLNQFADTWQPTYKIIELESKINSSKIYLKSKNWGVTGDRQISIISSDNDREFEEDSIKEYIFKGL